MESPEMHPSHRPSMVVFAGDLPNICSLAGLFCALSAIYFCFLGHFRGAVCAMLWAVLFDAGDGIIARKMKNRSKEKKAVGAQLDSLIDIVSFGICPAVLLMSYGGFNPWLLPGAFFILGVSAIRLSYFNVFGMLDDSTYIGLALDNNVIILSMVFLLEGWMSKPSFLVLLYIVLMGLSVLNAAPVRTPKLTGRWVYGIAAYTLVMTLVYLS